MSILGPHVVRFKRRGLSVESSGLGPESKGGGPRALARGSPTLNSCTSLSGAEHKTGGAATGRRMVDEVEDSHK